MAWSRVGGLWMNASRENTTRPMRSNLRSWMKSAMISFAAPNLLGSRSVSPILPDMSSAMDMSTPSPRMTSLASPICGLAAATMTNASARNRSIRRNGIALRRSDLPLPETSQVSRVGHPDRPPSAAATSRAAPPEPQSSATGGAAKATRRSSRSRCHLLLGM